MDHSSIGSAIAPPTPQAAGNTQDKHANLYSAICNVHSIVHHLTSLKDQIQGPTPQPPVEPSDKRPSPSLSEVLSEGPALLRDTTDQAHQLIEEIKSILF